MQFTKWQTVYWFSRIENLLQYMTALLEPFDRPNMTVLLEYINLGTK